MGGRAIDGGGALAAGHEKERRPWKSWATLPLASLNSRSVILPSVPGSQAATKAEEIESIDVERTSGEKHGHHGDAGAFSRLRVNRSS
jgi:hypothetical protein